MTYLLLLDAAAVLAVVLAANYVVVLFFSAVGFLAGPPAVAEAPFAIPLPQPSQPPSNITLEAVDGSTLRVDFSPPSSTGGEEVDR